MSSPALVPMIVAVRPKHLGGAAPALSDAAWSMTAIAASAPDTASLRVIDDLLYFCAGGLFEHPIRST